MSSEQLQTRRSSPLRFGLVKEQDIPNARVRVTLPDLDEAGSYWLHVVNRGSQYDKDFWIPDVGEQVACLMDDHDESGVVLGSFFQSVDTPQSGMTADTRAIRFKDGAQIEYDRNQHVLSFVAQDGSIIKYDAGVHTLTVGLPNSGANLTVTANGCEILINGGGDIVLSTPVDLGLTTSLGTTSLNTIIAAINSIINLLKTAVQSGAGIAGTPPEIT